MGESIVYSRKPRSLLAAISPRESCYCALDSSGVWIHSCRKNPVKCNEVDEYMRGAKPAKHGQHQNAIVAVDIQEQGVGWEATTSRRKRTRCMNSLENADVLKKSKVDEGCCQKPSSTAEQASSKSNECDSSASNSEDPDGDRVSKSSSVVGRKKLKLIEELKFHINQQTINDKDQSRDGINTKTTGNYLDLEAEKLHQSPFASNCVDRDSREIVLVDVQMTFHASPRSENVPFVSLTSEAYGLAIMGYPLDVGEVRDASETLLLSEEGVESKLFGDRGSILDKLVWRTSKRTPVCYVTSSVSASGQAGESIKDSKLPAGKKGLLGREKSLMKLLKNTKQCKQEKAAHDKTCVPVELVFSTILAAVN